MSTTPEGNLKLKVKEFLNSLGILCFWFMPMMMGYGKRGIPDFVVCYKGRYVTIETKCFGRPEGPAQVQRGEEIEAAQGIRIRCNLKTENENMENIKSVFRAI